MRCGPAGIAKVLMKEAEQLAEVVEFFVVDGGCVLLRLSQPVIHVMDGMQPRVRRQTADKVGEFAPHNGCPAVALLLVQLITPLFMPLGCRAVR